MNVTAIFFRKPDGTPWVKFTEEGLFAYAPVVEFGRSLLWAGAPMRLKSGEVNYTRYAVYPDDENHLTGDTSYPWGTVDLTCGSEAVPQITSVAAAEVPKFEPGFQSGKIFVPDGACRK